MTDTKTQLIGCFQAVFPDLSPEEICQATQADLSQWDSITTLNLLAVVEDEFRLNISPAQMSELDSFKKIAIYLQQQSK